MASLNKRHYRQRLLLFLFYRKNRLSKMKPILPALADPAAEGDHAYPVLLRYNKNFLLILLSQVGSRWN